MYEETKSSIDWKGIFLKVIIAFLVILIAVKGYQTLKGNNDKKETSTTQTVAESKNSSTFTANFEKLREAGEKYFTDNKDKMPTTEGTSSMVTLTELIEKGYITPIYDENGKSCQGESSYVTALLEGKKTKIKSNLVCGSATTYSLVYMDENETEKEEKVNETKSSVSETNNKKTSTSTKTSTNTNSTTKTNNTSSNKSTTTSNTCVNGCATPNVTVNSNASASSTIKINEKENNKNETVEEDEIYYTVKFNSNGGNKTYSSKKVLKNDTVEYPGSTYKSGYEFEGWYLNSKEYDFSTPVTKDITLVAKFTRVYDEEDNYYYDDDYYYDRYDTTKKTTSDVYTLTWDKKGTDFINVTHTIKLPSTLANKSNIDEVRIKKIDYKQALNTLTLVNTYESKFNRTFFYTPNGGEKNITSNYNLATIKKSAVNIKDFDDEYVDFEDAKENGFEVNWTADSVYSQCSRTFSVTNKYTNAYADNLCAYGIVYTVTWEYTLR